MLIYVIVNNISINRYIYQLFLIIGIFYINCLNITKSTYIINCMAGNFNRFNAIVGLT